MMKLGRSEASEDIEARVVKTANKSCNCTRDARNITCNDHGG